ESNDSPRLDLTAVQNAATRLHSAFDGYLQVRRDRTAITNIGAGEVTRGIRLDVASLVARVGGWTSARFGIVLVSSIMAAFAFVSGALGRRGEVLQSADDFSLNWK